MPDLLENVHLLEHLASGILVLDVGFVDTLDGHVLASELVDPKSDLAERAFAQQFDELIEIKGRVGYVSVLLDMCLDVLD